MPLIQEEISTFRLVYKGFKCNKCGVEHYNDDGPLEILEAQEVFHWSAVGGYGSAWGDENRVEITLCQKCAYELLHDYAIISVDEE